MTPDPPVHDDAGRTDAPFRAGSTVRTERSLKRVRAHLGGRVAFDTVRALLVWEKPQYPTYYIPVHDVLAELPETGGSADAPDGTVGRVHDVRLGDVVATGAATTFPEAHDPALLAHVRIAWKAMEAWFEEDEEVFVHPRSPYVRIDALRSSRHVVIELDGVVLAETRHPVVLHETGLIPRYYLPPTDVRRDLLVPADTATACPYKGTASYWSLEAGELHAPDLAWTYRFPTREALPIAGLVAFYDERVDVTIDDVRQPRPSSPLRPTDRQAPAST
jgi:uncharacterized protein (DUF427 family)